MTELERLLKEAVKRGPMTPAEIEAQRRAYVLAEAGFGSDEDERAYAKAVIEQDAEELKRLNREAKERMASADQYLGNIS